jgi:hypothetical protein
MNFSQLYTLPRTIKAIELRLVHEALRTPPDGMETDLGLLGVAFIFSSLADVNLLSFSNETFISRGFGVLKMLRLSSNWALKKRKRYQSDYRVTSEGL